MSRLLLAIALGASLAGCAHLDPDRPSPKPVAVNAADCNRDQCEPIQVRGSRALDATVILHEGSCFITLYLTGEILQIEIPQEYCNRG